MSLCICVFVVVVVVVVVLCCILLYFVVVYFCFDKMILSDFVYVCFVLFLFCFF